MNYIDLLLIAIILISAWTGIRQGFINSAVGLLSWVASLALAFLAYKPIAALFHIAMPSAGFWLPPFSFLVSITLAKLVIDAAATWLLKRLPAGAHKTFANKAMGIIPGVITGIILTMMLAAVLLLVPFTNRVSHETRNSLLANRLAERVSWLDDSLSPVFAEALNRTVSKSTAAVNNEHDAKLPFRVINADTRQDLEAEMLVLVNKERAAYKLQPLKADPAMAVVARKHSADMFARSYFSHYTPEGADPFARMRKNKITFLTAGENLALAQTLIMAHNGLMNSPGHRANILNPNFGRLGIGILDGGVYGLMITQEFRN
ncbi:CvpA family protein [Mucilaginibacter sp.]|uniref:CvpA family protein n=1 Tax=Mucilaginibacter sp. TaxID=1882438 RepID=UPI0035BBAD65